MAAARDTCVYASSSTSPRAVTSAFSDSALNVDRRPRFAQVIGEGGPSRCHIPKTRPRYQDNPYLNPHFPPRERTGTSETRGNEFTLPLVKTALQRLYDGTLTLIFSNPPP